jgi:hypothetical protein
MMLFGLIPSQLYVTREGYQQMECQERNFLISLDLVGSVILLAAKNYMLIHSESSPFLIW